MKILSSLFLCLLCGCSVLRQNLVTEITHPDGSTERQTTHATAYSFWDSKESIAKLHVGNGKTQSIGVTGLEQESSSTNAVALFKAGIEALVKTAFEAGKGL